MNKFRMMALAIGLLLPPFTIGVLSTFSFLSDTLFYRAPEPLAGTLSPTQAKPGSVLLVLGDGGTQASDFLIAYEELSKLYPKEVRVIAPEQKLYGLTGGLAVLPDLTFADAPNEVSLLVVPALLKPEDEKLKTFLNQIIPRARQVLTLGEGIQAIPAESVQGIHMSTSIYSRKKAQKKHPSLAIDTKRCSQEGKWTSSAGRLAVYSVLGEMNAKDCENESSAAIGFIDLFPLLFATSYLWERYNVGVEVTDGVSESALASWIDTLPRTLIARTVTFANERRIFHTANGLSVIPELPRAQLPKLDAEFKPTTGGKEAYFQNLQWIAKNLSLSSALLSAQLLNMDQTKITELSFTEASKSYPPVKLLLRPLGLSILGGLIALWVIRRVQKNLETARRSMLISMETK